VHDALVLAGGSARRLNGTDKVAELVAGVSLLDRVLQASASASTTIVVGPERRTCRPVLWTREAEVGAGPVAAVVAGLALVTAPVVLLLAADLPLLTPEVVATLVAAVTDDGAMLVDGEGRSQFLCSAWRTDALRGADPGADRMGALLRGLRAQPVVCEGEPWADCDTPEDLAWVRERAVRGVPGG
jgi:molybdopterin-guanine dinucleotide biosynthesis protein A